MQLIDGYNGGVAHITASMIRDHNLSLYGTNDCVLPVGSKFSYEVVDNNTIRINDGMAVIGGARATIEYGQQETAIIENGVAGYRRNDIIAIEYSKDNESLVESAVIKVIKGELGSSGVDPELVDGDVRAGATVRQMALYRVNVNGLSIESVDTLWNAAVFPKSSLDLTGVETKTLLWENASPTSDFSEQTLSLPLSDYDYVRILSTYATTSTTMNETICKIGNKNFIKHTATAGTGNVNYTTREVEATTDSIIFKDAYRKVISSTTAGTVTNAANIPVAIYGIKEV